MDSLPDDILIHILSFLPMKQAALTSVLSKRWRTLFAFTHNLDFDDPFVNNRDKRISNPDEWRKIRKIFRDFVGRTLALQAGRDVKKLSLTVKHIRERSTKHWIRYALKHGVSELHICTTGEMSFLFRDYFTSTTLVKLSLTSLFGITSLPSDTSLPSLKILSLDGIVFRGGQLSDVLLAACPLLEDFTIHHGDYHPESADAISGKTIKNLNYSGKPLFEYYQFDLLVKATLDLRVRVPWFIKQNVEKLLSGIHNVKTLHLTISTVEVISVCCPSIPVFNNLVDLVFSSNEQGWIEFFPRLLECSPNLKVLVLSGLHFYAFQIHHGFVGIEIPLENQIEMLSIKQYQGSANEFTHINHILLKMKHLKELKVYVALTMDESKKMQLTKDLMKLPTASSHEVKISVM